MCRNARLRAEEQGKNCARLRPNGCGVSLESINADLYQIANAFPAGSRLNDSLEIDGIVFLG